MIREKTNMESKRCSSLKASVSTHCNFVENTECIINRKINCETIFSNELAHQFFGHTEKKSSTSSERVARKLSKDGLDRLLADSVKEYSK